MLIHMWAGFTRITSFRWKLLANCWRHQNIACVRYIHIRISNWLSLFCLCIKNGKDEYLRLNLRHSRKWWLMVYCIPEVSSPQYNSRFHHPKNGAGLVRPVIKTAVLDWTFEITSPRSEGVRRWLTRTYMHFSRIKKSSSFSTSKFQQASAQLGIGAFVSLSTPPHTPPYTHQPESAKHYEIEAAAVLTTAVFILFRVLIVFQRTIKVTKWRFPLSGSLVWWPVLSTRTTKLCNSLAHLLKDKK